MKVSSLYVVNLLQACENGHFNIVKILHKQGASVDIQSRVRVYIFIYD